MSHQFHYPKVVELRTAAEGAGAQPDRRPRSQRELVVASLLRCPDRRSAQQGR
jgi:hypothetical protein